MTIIKLCRHTNLFYILQFITSSEVFDMLHSRDDNQEHIDLPTFPEDMEDVHVEVTGIPDAEAEFLQGLYIPGPHNIKALLIPNDIFICNSEFLQHL